MTDTDPIPPEARHAFEDLTRLYGAGDLAAARTAALAFTEQWPHLAAGWNVLAALHGQTGAAEAGLAACARAFALAPGVPEFYNNQGNLLLQCQRWAEAETAFRAALKRRHRFVEAQFGLARALEAQEKTDAAAEAYQRTYALQPDHVAALRQAIPLLRQGEKPEPALQAARRLLRHVPGDRLVRLWEAQLLQQLGNPQGAEAAYRALLNQDPGNGAALQGLGNALQEQGRLAEAEAAMREAWEREPNSLENTLNLLWFLEKRNRLDEMRPLVAQAEHLDREDARVGLARAQLLTRDNQWTEARALLERLVFEDQPFLESTRLYTLGRVLDRLDAPAEAFAAAARANHIRAATGEVISQRERQRLAKVRIRRLCQTFTPEAMARWSTPEITDAHPDPVFLVGFPRSGTTLLGTILNSHPLVRGLDERPLFDRAWQGVVSDARGEANTIAQLDAETLARVRHSYFSEVERQLVRTGLGPVPAGGLLVDKMPLNLMRLGVLARVFPRARFIEARRHPCDAVLSCFMQNFDTNLGMNNFLDLDTAAEFYDLALSALTHYASVLPLALHTVRYESLITDFETEARALLAFLGLPWDDAVRDYRQTASRQTQIRTPSYTQVTQPLYTRARGRWERYRAQLAPVMPVLRPWITTLGYPAPTAEDTP